MTQKPVEVTCEMLIRKPVADVFEAFVNPDVTTNFWFTRSSGNLEPGAQVRWDWEMYGASAQVDVKEVVQNERILIEWDGGETVEWLFTQRTDDETFVTIKNSGFSGDSDQILERAVDAKGGFTIVLCGLKAWLEHGIALNLIADQAPDANIA
jgi:uncharacterized protein YndB with AHSA1/START domain